jgi:hypothetical protein
MTNRPHHDHTATAPRPPPVVSPPVQPIRQPRAAKAEVQSRRGDRRTR